MSVIRKSDLQKMDEKGLNEKIIDLKKELMKVNAKRASGTTLEKAALVKETKRAIARLLTLLTQKKLKKPKEERKKDV